MSTTDYSDLALNAARVKKRQKECYSNPGQDSLCATPNLKSNSRKNVWVHDCCCLASHSQDFVPSSSQKMELASVGLGLKNLTFLKMATDEEIESVIYEAFPKLAGLGFELLRTGSHKKN